MKNIFLVIISFLILIFTLRGNSGSPSKSTLNDSKWTTEGPFELSPERGRFALTFSFVEDKSLEFDLPVARFATPDLGYVNGKYVSLFAPGVSFLTIPGYKLGKMFGISQVGTFVTVSLFASLNVLLIYLIAVKLGARSLYSALASLAFLFATPSFTYAVSLYQHHISTFLLLAGVWVFLNFKGIISSWFLWFLVAASFSVDYPNFFLMAPLAILAFLRLIRFEDQKEFFRIKLETARLFSMLGIIFPLIFLGWVNTESYGNPFQLSGTVATVKSIDSQGLPRKDLVVRQNNITDFRSDKIPGNSEALSFFNSRNISNGLYVHLLSPDRGVVSFAPFLIFSIFGAVTLYRKKSPAFSLLFAIFTINLILYSMWGDPWGGWAYGSRYLIPSYAVFSIFLAFGLEKISGKKLVKHLLFASLIYSIGINTLGAITTSANPPKVEILKLEELSGKEEKYTPERNWDYLKNYGSKSFVYQNFLSNALSPTQFYFVMIWAISMIFTGLFYFDYFKEKITKYLPIFRFGSNKFEGVLEGGYPKSFSFSNAISGLKFSLWKN